ncbi:Hypothetical predicted protein [Marmota monax]|uniref:Uncharacterized protein n=1 Tax=Marmota monax TaxID=9995 RepID=A0A5E4BDD8_MARMO|nr:hypothetical protein GHT09_013797 [Marmota monax]VTJ66990.1 Hypothetical predicted protein [Marmota monax]
MSQNKPLHSFPDSGHVTSNRNRHTASGDSWPPSQPPARSGRSAAWPQNDLERPAASVFPPDAHLLVGRAAGSGPQDPVSRVNQDDSWDHPGPSAPGCPRTVSIHPSVPRPHLDPQPGWEHSGRPSRARKPWGPLHPTARQPRPSLILLTNSQLAPVPCLSLPPGPTLYPDSPGQGHPQNQGSVGIAAPINAKSRQGQAQADPLPTPLGMPPGPSLKFCPL